MSRYPNEEVARFDRQFAESSEERNLRLRSRRDERRAVTLLTLIADLSPLLAREIRADDWATGGTDSLRRRVANALPPGRCPEWLAPYRDPAVVQS